MGVEPEPDASGVCVFDAEREVGPDHKEGTEEVPGVLVNNARVLRAGDLLRERRLSMLTVRGGVVN